MEILDLIAKVSWETNTAELSAMNKELKTQDKMLEELKSRGQRLEEQMRKTNDPKKQAAYSQELVKTKASMQQILDTQKKQADATKALTEQQKKLYSELAKTTDPKQYRQMVTELSKVEMKLQGLNTGASDIPGKLANLKTSLSGIGQGIAGGLGLGAGMFGLEAIVGSIKSFVSSANEEFLAAEKSTMRLQNTLKNLGKEEYFDSLTSEAEGLAKQIGYLDNDDIVSAQQKMLAYGKLSRNEISKLLPLIIDLAATMETDVPTATETMINIMEGRGGATLRQMGLTIKDANNSTERLGIIFEELGPKIAGSAEAVKQSAEGMGRILDQQIADLQESVGKSTVSISNYFKETIIGFLTMVDRLAKTEKEQRQKLADDFQKEQQADLTTYTNAELEGEKKRLPLLIKEIEKSYAKQRELQKQFVESNPITSPVQMRKLKQAIKSEEQQRMFVEAQVKAIVEESKRRDDAAFEDELMNNKRAAEDAKEQAEKAAKAQADAAEKSAEERARKHEALKEKIIGIETEITESTLTGNDLARAKIDAKYDALEREARGYADILAKLKELREIEEGRIIDAPKIDTTELRSELEQLSDDVVEGARKTAIAVLEELQRMNPASEFLKSIDIGALSTSQINQIVSDYKEGQKNLKEIDTQRGEIQAKQREKDKETAEEKKARNAQERQDLFDNTMMLADMASQQLAIEQNKVNELINLQNERVEKAREDSSASVKIEEDRLAELLEKRQKFERAQRLIDAATIAANQAVAISAAITSITKEAAKLGPAGVIANVIAVTAGIGATLLAVRNAFSDVPQFREGGYTGDGNPDETSTAIGSRPYVYHKKEFVMDEGLTTKHRDMFEGMHKRKLMVQKLDDGQFYVGPKLLNTDAMVSAHESIKQDSMIGLQYELMNIRELLEKRELNITNTFDANGFGVEVAAQLGKIHIRNKNR